ncbi:MAG: glycosyltransferase family 2 protein, partial [Cyclobacteriaceae bacterium]
MRPKVSIIIPVYNAELFLAETINSVLNQNFKDFELLLVNDGSTDGSGQICQSFEDDRITYLEIENGGVSNARNIGFKKSKGDYLAFLDADDVWLENRLGRTVELLDTDQELGLVHTNMQVIDEKSNKQDIIHAGKSGHILDDLLLWEECCIPAPSSILVRRPVMEHVGLFDLRL